MKCIYYLAPSLSSTRHISDDLHETGVKDFFLHVITKDESGLKQQHIHSSNYFETLDIVRDGVIGGIIGCITGLAGVLLLKYFPPFSANVPTMVYAAIVAVATLFGTWVGGLTGTASESKKLAKFHDDIAAGKYLILIYVRKEQETAVLQMMKSRHTEANLVAIDRHFINPFSAVKRDVEIPLANAGLAQNKD